MDEESSNADSHVCSVCGSNDQIALQPDGRNLCPGCASQSSSGQPWRPRRWLAVLLGILVPGLGHFYVSSLRPAILVVVASVLAGYAALTCLIRVDTAPLNLVLFAVLVLGYYLFVGIDLARRTRKDQLVLTQHRKKRPIVLVVVAFGFWLGAYLASWPITSAYQAYNVPTSAMEFTIMVGDYILADLDAYDSEAPEPGDVVVFLWPGDSTTNYVKRCVAGPGQLVEMREKRLFVDGVEEVILPTIQHGDHRVDHRRDSFGPYRVPPDCFFMLGDNRDDSYDSRFWGPVPARFLLGRVVRIHWSRSFDRIGLTVR